MTNLTSSIPKSAWSLILCWSLGCASPPTDRPPVDQDGSAQDGANQDSSVANTSSDATPPDTSNIEICSLGGAVCKIDDKPASCSDAFRLTWPWSTLGGPKSQRQLCEQACVAGTFGRYWTDYRGMAGNKTSCQFFVEINGFTCDACCTLDDILSEKEYCWGRAP